MTTSIISDSQKDFIVSSIKNDFRIDGRSNKQPQEVQIKINNLDHLLGSCLLNIQGSQNQVHIYTGIKIKVENKEINKKESKKQNIRNRVILELGCIKKLSEQEEQIRSFIQEYLNKYVIDNHLNQFQSLLSINNAKKHFLVMNIEVYILSTPHISYLQHIFTCVKLALQNLKIPEFDIVFNEVTDQQTIEVKPFEDIIQLEEKMSNIDLNQRKQKINPYKGLSALKIIGVIEDFYIQGLTVQEYQSIDSAILLAFNNEQRVVAFQTLKRTTKIEELHQIIKFAKN